jgi:hypothetical protein
MLLLAAPPAISAVLAALQGNSVVFRQPNIVLPSVRAKHASGIST